MELVKYNNNSISSVTALDSIASGSLVLLATNNITSGVSSSSFTSNINSTYDTYMFKFINMHPATDGARLTFQGSTNSGSSYGITLTSTYFRAGQSESGTTDLSYATDKDLAQSTSFHLLTENIGTDNDQQASGTVFLFSPSSDTFVKHFISDSNSYHNSDYSFRVFTGGYFNTTSAIDAIQFKMSSGNIDSGVIKMYGLSKS